MLKIETVQKRKKRHVIVGFTRKKNERKANIADNNQPLNNKLPK